MKMSRGPKNVCARFAKRGMLKVALLPADDDGGDYILLEGNAAAYEFLGRLFLAHAKAHDCGFQISPKGAGSTLFKKGSAFGLYLHRLPCNEKPRRSR
jgi:hypothetical protein